jgi:hypothetical protein
MLSHVMSQSGLDGEPEANPEAASDHDALTAIVNAAIATHLFEHLCRVDSLEEQVDRLQERLLALEKAPGRQESHGRLSLSGRDLEDTPKERTTHMQRQTSPPDSVDNIHVEALRRLEDQVQKLTDTAAESEGLLTKEFMVQKFNDVEGDITMLREESGTVRDHFVWFEEQVEKWRISWAMFALSATTMKESDRRDCMERLKEEDSRLANANFSSGISHSLSDPDAVSASSRAHTQKSAPSVFTGTSSRFIGRGTSATVDQFVPAPISTSGISAAGSLSKSRVNFASP